MKIAILLLSAFVLAVNCFPQQRQTDGCNTGCPMYIIQFCGSDGQTYNSNPCFVKSQLSVNCHPHRRQVAGCSTFCPMYVMTFCGSDGQTYTSNPCVVKSQKCMKGANDFDTFTSVHYGACTGDELKEATTVA